MLASAYVQRAWYPRTPALVLNPAWRVPALVQHISTLGADILCLQEVEPETFVALRTSLAERGYGAQYARKTAGCPEGCAIFYRRESFELISIRAVAYEDGGGAVPGSGSIALLALCRTGDGVLGVVNTHLTWDPPNTAPAAQRGLRQAQQLLSEQKSCAANARGWIIAGDFNATPGSEIIAMLERAGFDYAHAGLAGVVTCNVNAEARMIDYLFHSSALRAEAQLPAPIDDKTILPSAEQPSDHVAILSQFTWNG